MSLIFRIEVTNYLTEGISPHRRVADWRPMLTGITLRMDECRSALVNITNGGGKTSLVEILLYLLSRDKRLLTKIRDKLSPKSRGYTHARIEFRSLPEDSFSSPGLLDVDPNNLRGETHVVGVALSDDVNEAPIFYAYSGKLEDSPCYHNNGKSIISIPDTEFINRTRSIPGCKWNKFNNRKEWEDHIGLFLSIEVVRRNVAYQLKGSDDKNASFFSFQAKGGETYDSAFFRSVIAPDLLTNLLGSFSEDNELSVEDTLHKSLSGIVAAEREAARKERHLEIRQAGVNRLQPILDAGRDVEVKRAKKDDILRGLRKDVALVRHFGIQGLPSVLPGLPRSPKSLPKSDDLDPRISQALKGMVITPDDGILIIDKTLSDLSGVDVGTINKTAERKQVHSSSTRIQAIDLYCLFGFSTSGVVGGGHYRKGYARGAATSLTGHLSGMSEVRINGLEQVLNVAFDIAEAQIDTNPASIEIRRLELACKTAQTAIAAAKQNVLNLSAEISGLESQIKDRLENQGAWEDFIKIGHLLPDQTRDSPTEAKRWLDKRIKELKGEIRARDIRSGELRLDWDNYIAVIELFGLEGLDGVKNRHDSLVLTQNQIKQETFRLQKAQEEAKAFVKKASGEIDPAYQRLITSNTQLAQFAEQHKGYLVFRRVFGDVHPQESNPEYDLNKVERTLKERAQEYSDARNELLTLERLNSQGSMFPTIFGTNVDPLVYDPDAEDRTWASKESAARQGMAGLLEKVEDLKSFEAAFPSVSPSDWIQDADGRRETLEVRQAVEHERLATLAREIPSIEQMCVVGAKFTRIFGLNVDPLTYDPDTEDRTWATKESAARQGMAGLLEKVEDLKSFEAASPGVSPSDWIKEADARREYLQTRQAEEQDRRATAEREVIAIEQMRVVEDGAFVKAWALIDKSGIQAQRLYELMLSDEKEIKLRTNALSALSGILAAPVFKTIEQLESVAKILSDAGISVPIIHEGPLLQAIDAGISAHGDLRLFGFIGGSYSRRVRILLEPAYAQSELDRLRQEIVESKKVLQQIENDLRSILPTSESYDLARRAMDAENVSAREIFATHKTAAEEAERHRSALLPRLTAEAKDVLRSAAEFICKEGEALQTQRLRILFEPAYAKSELDRRRQEIVECEKVLQQVANALLPILRTSENYALARRAMDAQKAGAREKFEAHKTAAEEAERIRTALQPQLTIEAKEVLRSVADFIRRGGESHLADTKAINERLSSELQKLEEARDITKNLASKENLLARDQARQYVSMGGESAHDDAEVAARSAAVALEALKVRLQEASEKNDCLDRDLNAARAKADEFEDFQHPEEISRLSKAIALADSQDKMEFMQNFTRTQDELVNQESSLTTSMSVNFERAAAFKTHMSQSDQEMQTTLAKKKQEHDAETNLISEKEKLVERYRHAEIPQCQKLAKPIHELAWEIGRRVAMTRNAAEGLADLEEGDAVVETHPLYPKISGIAQNLSLKTLDSLGSFFNEPLNELIGIIQDLDLEDAVSKLKASEAEHKKALETYTNLKESFCAESRDQPASKDRAFNALEIEEIEKASPERIKALGELFVRLKATLEKDRDDARRAKAVAEDANKDSLKQLSGLIRVAQDNLTVLEKVMARYPEGRFFVKAEIAGEERITEILNDLKEEVERANREQQASGHTLRRTDDTRIKQILRDTLIDRVFMETEVQFINAGIWFGKRSYVTNKLSTGQKIALEFMWIIRQAEYEIERGLRELTSKQAAKSRARTNRMIMIDGIFSTLSDRNIIKEALNGLRGLGGNFQIIGFLHSQTWVNDYTVFPIYHVGKKLTNSAGNGLISFSEEGRNNGTVGFFSSIVRPSALSKPDERPSV